MSNIVHIVGTRNATYLVLAVWAIGFVGALKYATGTAAELGNAMTHKPATVEVAKK